MGNASQLIAALAAGLLLAGCTSGETGSGPDPSASPAPNIVQPGAPGEPNVRHSEMPDVVDPEPTEEDVEFVHAMLAHHEQAVVMTALVPDRSERDDVPLFAERIAISQDDEMDQMLRWLETRDLPMPDDHEHHHHAHDMPGMLTQDQLDELEAAQGEEFDRLFLELMYFHHEGALIMVEELLLVGGQEPELWQLIKHIDGDQRIEMDRIQGMLADMGHAAP